MSDSAYSLSGVNINHWLLIHWRFPEKITKTYHHTQIIQERRKQNDIVLWLCRLRKIETIRKGKIRRRQSHELSHFMSRKEQWESNTHFFLMWVMQNSTGRLFYSWFLWFSRVSLTSLFLRWLEREMFGGWERHLWGHHCSQVPVLPKTPLWNLEKVESGHQGQRSGRWACQGDYPTYGLSHWVYRQDNKLCIVI